VEQIINNLKQALQKNLPGQAAQYIMAPSTRPNIDLDAINAKAYKPSAVMILFCQGADDTWFLPLTQRFSYIGAHGGQISLPGGKFDKVDVSLEQTAIRECFEEIGVKNDIEVLGKLTPLHIPVSGFLVEPYVGIYTKKQPEFKLQEREVKTIIKLKMIDLLNNDIIHRGNIDISDNNKGLKIDAPYFLIDDQYKIWGATAMILSELKTVTKAIF
jgi:8-oxo-dGTP pyrophosphatase MutT (NUDIX family)